MVRLAELVAVSVKKLAIASVAAMVGGYFLIYLLAYLVDDYSHTLFSLSVDEWPERIRYIGYAWKYSTMVTMWTTVAAYFLHIELQAKLRNKRLAAARDSRAILDKRIARLNDALRDSGDLLDELQRELRIQEAARTKILAELDEKERLAQLNREQAEAVTSLIREVTEQAHTRLKRDNRREQVLYFVLGLIASIPIGMIVNIATG